MPKTIRAKFEVASVTRHSYGGESVKLQPVYPGPNASDEDKAFWDATPQGALEMAITNKAAHGFFEPGQKFYLDFTPAAEG